MSFIENPISINPMERTITIKKPSLEFTREDVDQSLKMIAIYLDTFLVGSYPRDLERIERESKKFNVLN